MATVTSEMPWAGAMTHPMPSHVRATPMATGQNPAISILDHDSSKHHDKDLGMGISETQPQMDSPSLRPLGHKSEYERLECHKAFHLTIDDNDRRLIEEQLTPEKLADTFSGKWKDTPKWYNKLPLNQKTMFGSVPHCKHSCKKGNSPGFKKPKPNGGSSMKPEHAMLSGAAMLMVLAAAL